MPQYIGGAPKFAKIVSLLLVHHKDCWASMVDLSNKIRCPTSMVRHQIRFYEAGTIGTTIVALLVNDLRYSSIESEILWRLTRTKPF